MLLHVSQVCGLRLWQDGAQAHVCWSGQPGAVLDEGDVYSASRHADELGDKHVIVIIQGCECTANRESDTLTGNTHRCYYLD